MEPKKISIGIAMALTTGTILALGCQFPVAAKPRVTIRFCSFQSGQVVETWKKQFADYEKQTGVRVVHEAVPWGETLTRHLTYMAGGVGRESAMLTAAYQNALAANGLLTDLQSLAGKLDPKFKFDDFWPKLLNPYKYKGRLYAMPSDLDLGLLWYNRDLFDQAGIKAPDETWDWNDYLQASIKLTKGNGQKKLQYGTLLPPWEVFVWQNGGSVLSDDASKCTIDSPEAVEAIQFVSDLLNKHQVVPRDGAGWETGKVGMLLGPGPYNAWYGMKNIKWRWGVAPMPKGKYRATTAWGSSFGIFKSSKYPKETWDFLKWFLSPEKQYQRANDWAWFPPGRSATTLEGFMNKHVMNLSMEDKKMVIDAIAYGRAPVVIRRQDDLNKILGEELDKVWRGTNSVKSATANIKTRVQKILK